MTYITRDEYARRLSAANKTIVALRHDLSVANGELALRPRPVVTQQRRIFIRGVEHDVVIEKHGARVIKRFVPTPV